MYYYGGYQGYGGYPYGGGCCNQGGYEKLLTFAVNSFF